MGGNYGGFLATKTAFTVPYLPCALFGQAGTLLKIE